MKTNKDLFNELTNFLVKYIKRLEDLIPDIDEDRLNFAKWKIEIMINDFNKMLEILKKVIEALVLDDAIKEIKNYS